MQASLEIALSPFAPCEMLGRAGPIAGESIAMVHVALENPGIC